MGPFRDLAQPGAVAEAAGEDRRADRLEQRVTGEGGVERLQPACGVEQEPGRDAAAHLGELQAGPQPFQSGVLELVERAGLGGPRQQGAGPVHPAGVDGGLGGGQGTARAAGGIGAEVGRLTQERRGGGGSAPGLGRQAERSRSKAMLSSSRPS